MSDGHGHDACFDWGGFDLLGQADDAFGDSGNDLARIFEADEVSLPAHPLPPHQLLAVARRQAAARRVRDAVFGRTLFLNPGWNILLELFIAGEEGRNVTIKSACVAAGVPQSTALRHIAHLIDVRLAIRAQHPSDARSAYLKLSEAGRAKMVTYITRSAEDPDAPDA